MSNSPEPDSGPSQPEAAPLKVLAAEKAGVLTPDDSVKSAGDRMRNHHTDTWPVAEGRKLIGMVAHELMTGRGLKFLPVVDREMRMVGTFNREEVNAMIASKTEPASEISDPEPIE